MIREETLMSTDADSEKRRLLFMALLLAIFMLGMGLRVYRLDSVTLSRDEFRTGTRAQLDLPSLLTCLASGEGAGVQLPLMYIVTHFALSLCGDSDFVLRLQATLFGSLSILLTYQLGQILWTRKEGLVAAFLLAVNPFYVEYSQIARHYGLMVFLALLSLIFLLKALEGTRKRLWIGFVLCASLSLYNHYFALLFLAAGVIFATWVIGENWLSYSGKNDRNSQGRASRRLSAPVKQALMFATSVALVGISFLPWLLLPAFGVMISSPIGPNAVGVSATAFQSSLSFLGSVLASYSGASRAVLLLSLTLFVTGLVSPNLKRMVLIIGWVAIPFAVLSFVNPIHFLHPRYVLFILPPYLLVIANGVSTVTRFLVRRIRGEKADWTRPLALTASLTVLLFGSLSVAPLRDYYSGRGGEPDWRGAADHLRANMRTGDIVLAAGGGPSRGLNFRTKVPMSYYLGQGGISIPPVLPADRGLWRSVIEHLGDGNQEVWAVSCCRHSAPAGHLENRTVIADFSGVSVISLREPSGDLLQDTVAVLQILLKLVSDSEVQFESHVALAEIYVRTGRFEEARVHLDMASQLRPDTEKASRHLTRTRAEFEQLSPATDERMKHLLWRSLGLQIALVAYDLGSESVPPGETLHLTLWWRALVKMNRDYTAFIHLIGPDKRIWAQQDILLQDDNDPTSTWELGKIVRQEYELQLPPDAPPGDYIIQAGSYYWETGQRLPMWDQFLRREANDAVILTRITLTERKLTQDYTAPCLNCGT